MLMAAITFFGIGASFLWDSQLPAVLEIAESRDVDLDLGYHIRASSGLTTILDDPVTVHVPVTKFGKFPEALPNHPWDALVLQVFSHNGLTYENDFAAVQEFAQLLGENGSETEIWIYETWQLGFQWEKWKDPVLPGQVNYDLWKREYYHQLVDELRVVLPNPIYLVPTGDIFYAARSNGFTGSELHRDGVHASPLMRVVLASTVFSLVTRQHPKGISVPAFIGGLENSFDIQRKINDLLSLAWEQILNEPRTGILRGDADLDGDVDITDFNRLTTNFGKKTSVRKIHGDVDADFDVDITDFNSLAMTFGNKVAGANDGDFDGDFDVDISDFNSLATNFDKIVRGASNGDFDEDFDVDISDFSRLAMNFGSTEETGNGGDTDGDFDVDISDFNVLSSNFGRSPAMRSDGDADGDGDVDVTDFNLLVTGLMSTHFGSVEGDFDDDDDVDISDFNSLTENFGNIGAQWGDGDFDGDGDVDVTDFNVLAASHIVLQGGTVEIPEPESVFLILTAFLFTVNICCRRNGS